MQENAVFLAVLLVLGSAFLFLRTKGTKFVSLEAFDTTIVSGQPVVVEFYGNT